MENEIIGSHEPLNGERADRILSEFKNSVDNLNDKCRRLGIKRDAFTYIGLNPELSEEEIDKLPREFDDEFYQLIRDAGRALGNESDGVIVALNGGEIQK